MTVGTELSGLDPKNYSNSTALRRLRKPLVSHNPIANVEVNPVKADMQGIRQVKQATNLAVDRPMPFNFYDHPFLTAAITGTAGALGALGGGGLGAAAGVPVGTIAGARRGRALEGAGRGLVRGATTGAGLGAGALMGPTIAEGFGIKSPIALRIAQALGSGLGGTVGWQLGGELLDAPRDDRDEEKKAYVIPGQADLSVAPSGPLSSPGAPNPYIATNMGRPQANPSADSYLTARDRQLGRKHGPIPAESSDIDVLATPATPKDGPFHPQYRADLSPTDFSGLGALGGAGLGGALGYMLSGPDDEERGKSNSMPRVLGTLAGGALGGGLGYMAGNPSVRAAIMNAMKEVTGAAADGAATGSAVEISIKPNAPAAYDNFPDERTALSAYGGAGLGGLAGNLLHRYYRGDAKDSDVLGSSLTTLGGAGLGGGLGYLVGHPRARAAIMNAMKEVIGSEKETKKEDNKKPKSKDMVDMDSWLGTVADLVPMTWGGERAGRTQAMAEAISEPTTFNVRHPLTHDIGSSSLGALGGGLAGAGIGAAASMLAPLMRGYPALSWDESTWLGAGLGALGGTLAGHLRSALSRRAEMTRVGKLYDENFAENRVSPLKPEFSGASALLLPFRGPHRIGQSQAYRAMSQDRPMQRSLANDLAYLMHFGGPISGLAGAYAQNANTQFADLDKKQPRFREPIAKEKEAAETESKDEKKDTRKKLGPIEQAYVADAVGGKVLQRLGQRLQQLQNDPNNEYDDLFSQLLSSDALGVSALGERINRGASRLSENQPWRLAAHLDPTAGSDGTTGLIGLVSGIGGGKDKAEGAKQRTAEAYAKFLKDYQDPLSSTAKASPRQTPFLLREAANLANLDADIAGHSYLRNQRPLHYWLNPLSASGPISETVDRLTRRAIAGSVLPDSTAGRAGMAAASLGTLGLLPTIVGGSAAQNKLRAAAAQSELYPEEAQPKLAADSLISKMGRYAAWLENEKVAFDVKSQPGRYSVPRGSVMRAATTGSRPAPTGPRPESGMETMIRQLRGMGAMPPSVAGARPEPVPQLRGEQ
jgi:hypothetical protein